jgi:hypothetical protein
MPSRRRMIQPNDLLILVGEPAVLKSVYRSIKRELGQFPEPFGTNLFLYLDINLVNHENVKEVVRRSVYTHKKFNHDLIIKVVNPSNIELLQYIKDFRDENIYIDIDYESTDIKRSFHDDIKAYHVGLVIVPREMFNTHKVRNMLYDAHVPVLKLADRSISTVKECAMILSDNRDLEKISATVFDISEQMEFNIEIYNYMNEHQNEKEQVIEHYYNLSTIFSKSIKVYKESENPIVTLRQKDNFIQILPFTNKIINRKISTVFSTDSEKLYYKLDDYHQIFIPVQL